MIDLTITLREDPEGSEQVFRLVAQDGCVLPGSTLPDPAAAVTAVEQFGESIFFPEPGPPQLCTQQYGGPQMAVVNGMLDGRTVHSVFTRTDGCEIARWKAMAPLLGATTHS